MRGAVVGGVVGFHEGDGLWLGFGWQVGEPVEGVGHWFTIRDKTLNQRGQVLAVRAVRGAVERWQPAVGLFVRRQGGREAICGAWGHVEGRGYAAEKDAERTIDIMICKDKWPLRSRVQPSQTGQGRSFALG